MQVRKVVRKTAEVGISMTILGALLAGCLGNDGNGPVGSSSSGGTGAGTSTTGSGSTGSTSGFVISGVAMKGRLDRAKATAYEVDTKGARIRALGSGVTSAKGEFSISLTAAPTTPVSIELSGGTYTSEKDGSTVTVTKPIYALLTDASAGASGVAVSPLSDMVHAHAVAHAASGTALTTAISDAEKFISKTFGLTGTSPTTVIPDFTTAALSAKSDAGKVALAIAALDGLAARLASGVTGISRDDVYAALSEDYADGLPDGKGVAGSAVSITAASGSASTALPSSALGFDLAAELKAVSAVVFAGADATSVDVAVAKAAISAAGSAVAAAAPVVGATVTAIVPKEVLSATGIASTSSGAMSYASIAGKQYLYIAARTKGVRKVDITDPAAPAEVTAPTWGGAALASNTGFLSKPIGGAMIVSSSTGVHVLAFAYQAKHIALLNPDTGAVTYEGDLPMTATVGVSFSGASGAFIAGAIPDPGKGAWLATADGYIYLDINATLAAGAGTTPVIGTKYAVPAGSKLAENLGGDIANNYLFAPNQSDLSIVNLSTTGALTTPGVYKLDTAYATTNAVPSGYKDGGAVDTAWGVGVITYEDTANVSFINLNSIAAGATANTFKPSATNGFKDVTIGAGKMFSGSSVDSKTHQVFGMAGYSNDIFVGQLQDPASVASGSWVGMSDWVYYTLTSYAYATDPHANATVYNTKTSKTYAYLLDGATAPTGVQQIDVSGLLGMTRAGTTGDAAHQPASNPTLAGGPISKISLAP